MRVKWCARKRIHHLCDLVITGDPQGGIFYPNLKLMIDSYILAERYDVVITVCYQSTSLMMPIGDSWDGFFYPTLTLMIYLFNYIYKVMQYSKNYTSLIKVDVKKFVIYQTIMLYFLTEYTLIIYVQFIIGSKRKPSSLSEKLFKNDLEHFVNLVA